MSTFGKNKQYGKQRNVCGCVHRCVYGEDLKNIIYSMLNPHLTGQKIMIMCRGGQQQQARVYKGPRAGQRHSHLTTHKPSHQSNPKQPQTLPCLVPAAPPQAVGKAAASPAASPAAAATLAAAAPCRARPPCAAP